MSRYALRGKTWIYAEVGGWYFVTLPKKQSKEIKNLFGMVATAFGSLRVEVTIGNTKWKTSIFPSKESEAYILPLKAAVRKREKLEVGNTIDYTIELVP